MAEDDFFWTFMCLCYFVGGVTIGYYISQWLNRRKKTGTGRWDYSNKTYKGDDRYK